MEFESDSPLLIEQNKKIKNIQSLYEIFNKQVNDIDKELNNNIINKENLIIDIKNFNQTFSNILNYNNDKEILNSHIIKKTYMIIRKETINKYTFTTSKISEKINCSVQKEKSFLDDQNKLIENELEDINRLVSEMMSLSESMRRSLNSSSLLVDNIESNSIDMYNYSKNTNDQVEIKVNNSGVSSKRLLYFVVFLVILVVFILFLIFK